MSELADDLAGTLAVSVWRRAAEAQTLTAAICEMEGHPLTELQVGYVAQAFLCAFGGVQAELASHLSVDAELRSGKMNWLLGYDIGGLDA